MIQHKQPLYNNKSKKAKSQEKYTAKKKNYHRDKNSLSPIIDDDYYNEFPKISAYKSKQLKKQKKMSMNYGKSAYGQQLVNFFMVFLYFI